MIYIKRLFFAIITVLTISLSVLIVLLLLLTIPIWGLILYTITGKGADIADELCDYIWENNLNFLDWYNEKYGPND